MYETVVDRSANDRSICRYRSPPCQTTFFVCHKGTSESRWPRGVILGRPDTPICYPVIFNSQVSEHPSIMTAALTSRALFGETVLVRSITCRTYPDLPTFQDILRSILQIKRRHCCNPPVSLRLNPICLEAPSINVYLHVCEVHPGPVPLYAPTYLSLLIRADYPSFLSSEKVIDEKRLNFGALLRLYLHLSSPEDGTPLPYLSSRCPSISRQTTLSASAFLSAAM